MLVKIIVLIILASFSQEAKFSLDREATIQILSGLMKGIIMKDNLEEMQICLKDTSKISDQLEEIKEDLKSKNIYGVFEGLKLAGLLMSQLPAELQDCEGMREDMLLFGKWAKIFTNPELLYQRLMHNMPAHFSEIWADIQDANKYLRRRDYWQYGESVGEALVLAVG